MSTRSQGRPKPLAARRVLLELALFVLLVDAVAWLGRGRLASPLPLSWDAEAIAEAPPLARFDSAWYRSIAKDGYSKPGAADSRNLVVFPLYPLLMRALNALFGLPLFWAGLLLSHVFCIAAVLLFHRYATDVWPEAPDATRLLLLFPFSFFLLAVYTESLFLLLSVGTLLAFRRRELGWAAFLGVLAGLTRVTGLALTPALLAAALAGGWRALRPTAALASLAPIAGFCLYAVPVAVRLHDPLFYLHAQQSGWARGPSVSGLSEALGSAVENVRSKGLLHLGAAVDVLVLALLAVAAVWLWSRGRAEAVYVGSGVLLIVV
ncbi:MAG TPA: hypothetical protein VKF32_00670, partial [Thermoanaerobaculia bacterium]|nr:hypothetical protein [Thermoanaerobaculia bacterium]